MSLEPYVAGFLGGIIQKVMGSSGLVSQLAGRQPPSPLLRKVAELVLLSESDDLVKTGIIGAVEDALKTFSERNGPDFINSKLSLVSSITGRPLPESLDSGPLVKDFLIPLARDISQAPRDEPHVINGIAVCPECSFRFLV